MNVLMIACHKNADDVIRFAERCRTDYTDIVIHCDSMMPTSEYQKLEEFSKRGGVFNESSSTWRT